VPDSEELSDMYVKRVKDAKIAAFINDSREHKNVMLVEGARQVGKTSC